VRSQNKTPRVVTFGVFVSTFLFLFQPSCFCFTFPVFVFNLSLFLAVPGSFCVFCAFLWLKVVGVFVSSFPVFVSTFCCSSPFLVLFVYFAHFCG